MVTCQVCGKENPPGVEYCEDCGAALTADVTSSTPAPQPPTAATDPSAPTATEASTPTPSPTPPTGTGIDVPPPSDAVIGTADLAGQAPDGSPTPPTAPPDVVAPTPEDSAPAPGATTPTAPTAPTGTGTAPAGGGRPRLIAKRHGAETSEEIPLQGDRLVVGRFDPDTGPVDIDLSNIPETPQISRHHAEIYREADGQWYVADLGSTNGVFVKALGETTFGPRITTPTPIPPGGEIAFGNARFVFRLD